VGLLPSVPCRLPGEIVALVVSAVHRCEGRPRDGITARPAGVVRLLAHRAASPCAWMDIVLAPGAHRALRGRGGLRCEPLSTGVLRVGPARLVVGPPAPGAAVPGAGPPPRC
jgi:hypothetical protein